MTTFRLVALLALLFAGCGRAPSPTPVRDITKMIGAPVAVPIIPVEALGTSDDIPSVSPLDARPVEVEKAGDGEGRVQVRGYFRKSGVYVRPHTRGRPRR